MPWHTEISSIRMSAFYLIFIISFTDNFGNKITRYRFPLVQQLQVDSLHWVCAMPMCMVCHVLIFFTGKITS